MTYKSTSSNSSITYLIAGTLFATGMPASLYGENNIPEISTYANINPSKGYNFNIDNNSAIYSYGEGTLSNNTLSVSTQISKDKRDFEIINNFAAKMLVDVPEIDEEIQRVINNHFWDMI